MEGVGKGILLVVVKCLLANTAVVGKFDVTWESRTVLFSTSDRNLDAGPMRRNIGVRTRLCKLWVIT
jgi:hypothetical protein